MQVSGNLLTGSWMQDFHTDMASVSVISSAFFYSYVLMQIPAGMLFDRFGIKRVLQGASLVFLLGMILLLLSHHIGFAILARLIMGAGAAFAFVSMVYVSSLWFRPSSFAMMVGLGEMIAMLGVALLEAIMPHLITRFGWREVLQVLVGIAVLQVLLISFALKNPQQHSLETPRPRLSLWQQLRAVIALKNIWCAGFFCCSVFGVVSIFAALWGNKFIQVVYQQSYYGASSLLSLLLLGVAVGGPIIGYLNERLMSYKALLLVNSGLLLLISLVIGSGQLTLLGLSILIFILGFLGSGYVLGFYVTQESTRVEIRGAGIGLCNAIALLGGGVFQPLTGLILDYADKHLPLVHAYQLAMLILPGVILLAFLGNLCIRLPRETGKNA